MPRLWARLEWRSMYSDESSSSESLDWDGDDEQAEGLRSGSFYLRSVRWVLLAALVIMALLSLYLFTEDARYKEYRLETLYLTMSNLALVALGIYGVYHVRVYYVIVFSVLLLGLMIYKFTTRSFQYNMLSSMIFHSAHFMALFCGFTFSCVALFHC